VGTWRSWQFGRTSSLLYKIFDSFRQLLNRNLITFLAEVIEDSPTAYVLEAGSGTAFASSLFASHPGIELSVAVDIDLSALEEARKRDPYLPLVVADLNALPFSKNSFDLIWNNSTMEHIKDPLPVLEAFFHLLKPTGKLFIGVPYQWGPLGIQQMLQRTRAGIWIGEVYNIRKLEILLHASGFSGFHTHLYFLNFFLGIQAGRSPE
jgi:SAM-dependent methyltransferase